MNTILLRFRDLTQNIDTVVAHNEIAEDKGSVLWGWWKKDAEFFPDPILSDIARDIEKLSGIKIFFINSDKNTYYEADLKKVFYKLGGECQPAPIPDLCPDYYKDKLLPAWFEIGRIVEVDTPTLSDFVISRENRTSSHSSSIPYNAIGAFVNDVNILSHPVSMWFLCPSEQFDYSGVRSVSNISSGTYHTKGKYILHLSDLHFGPNHGYRNPLSAGNPTSKSQLIEDLVEDIQAWNPEVLNKIGLVLITGDLTWNANPHEFSNAARFTEQLQEEFGLSNCHIVVVPGNHDIEWLDNEGNIDINANLNYSNFYKTIYGTLPMETMLKINQFKLDGKNVCIIAINSCRLESKENAGYGYVGYDQLKKIKEYLERNKNNIDYSIALLHHHVLPVNHMEEYDPKSKRISMLLDAEATISTLVASGVNAILHGHQHQPYYSVLRRIIPDYIQNGNKIYLDKSINIIGGGSIGVRQDKVNAIGRNTYNILEFKDNELMVHTRISSGSGAGFYSDTSVKYK